MKEQTKKIVLLVIICVLTLVVLAFAIKINEKRKNAILSRSVIEKTLTEIRYEDIQNYVSENLNAIIYVSNSSDHSSRNYEEIFKNVVINYNLENTIIYININNININDPIYEKAPELVFYKDGFVSDVISCDTLKKYSDIVKIFKERGIIGD